jgi:hypothetical protein
VSVAACAVKGSSCFRNLLVWFCAVRSISEVKQHLCLWTCIEYEFLYVVRRELFLCISSWFKEATDVQLMCRVYLYIVARGTVAFTEYLGRCRLSVRWICNVQGRDKRDTRVCEDVFILHTIIIPTKCTRCFLLKAQDITICTFLSCIFAPTCFNPRGSSSGGSTPVPG